MKEIIWKSFMKNNKIEPIYITWLANLLNLKVLL